MKKIALIISLLCTSGLFAQTANTNLPHTDRFHLNMFRDHLDTLTSKDTTTNAPTNKGFNGNWRLIDSVMNVHSQHDSLVQLSTSSASAGGWFGNGRTGALGITADTVLGSDINCTTLRLNSNVHLMTGGYRIFADSIFIGSGAVISDTGRKGNNGTAGGNGTCPSTAGSGGGQAGASITTNKVDGYIARLATTAIDIHGEASVGTQSGNTGAGTAGTSTVANMVGSAGVAGGRGGNTDIFTAGAGGAAGATTALAAASGSIYNVLNLYLNRAFTTSGVAVFRWVGFSGGGGGGCGSNGTGSAYGQGGGGGGAGEPGGVVWVAARSIAGTGSISAAGGAGGNGGNGGNSGGGGCTSACGAGGGGGGGGGTGGLVFALYSKVASGITFSVSAGTGGTGGTAGTGGCTPQGGTAGTNGNTGVLVKVTVI